MSPTAGSAPSGPENRTKRKRVVLARPSHDYCRTCRARRIRCGGERPVCQQCAKAGRYCGYASWEMQVAGRAYQVPPLRIIAQRNANRMQLLSRFLEDRFPARALASPELAHARSFSLLHLCAEMDLPSPLLIQAIDALCVTSMAHSVHDKRVLQAASISRTNLFGMLRRAVDLHESKLNSDNARDIVIAIIITSLMAPLIGDSAEMHLAGGLNFIATHGSSFLDGNTRLDAVVRSMVQLYSFPMSVARRKHSSVHETPGWKQVSRARLQNEFEVSVAIGFVNNSSSKLQPAPRPLRSANDRNILQDLFEPLPGLLEIADAFCKAESLQALPPAFVDEVKAKVQHFEHVYATCIVPGLLDSAHTMGPMVSNDEMDAFDMEIEEHRFLSSRRSDFIKEYFRFLRPHFAFLAADLRFTSLMADSALLQILYCTEERDKRSSDWFGVSKSKIEQRAAWMARESCRLVWFYSQRSLSAAIMLRALVSNSMAFFESYGDDVAREWCKECLEATSRRIERLQTSTVSLCPVMHTFPIMATATSYKVRANAWKSPKSEA